MLIRWFFMALLMPLQLFSVDTNQTTIAPIVSYLLSDSENKKLGRIMPLGDSITWDWYYYDRRPDSLKTGYRSHLWWKLKDTHYEMNFVGSRSNGSSVSPSYDGDNEGHTGEDTYYIALNMDNWLKQNTPDTILLHIGTNDPRITTEWQAVHNIEYTLNVIEQFERKENVKIKVILAKIISYPAQAAWVSSFNSQLDSMAQQRIDAGDDIIVVDMENGANLDYSKDLIDGIHPTNCGYEKMANVWYEALTGKDGPGLKSCY